MPPTKVEIALVVSTVPVGPRQTDLKRQPFAFHLSAAFKPSALVPTPGLRTVLRPWLSNWSFDRSLVKVIDKANQVTDLPGKRIDTPLRGPASIKEALQTLQTKIAGEGRVETWDPVSLGNVKNGNQPKEPSLIEAVHALSLYPGGIPQESRLLNFFSVDGWPAEPVRMIAAPEFRFEFKKDDGTTATLTCKLKAGFKIDEWPNGWDYDISQDGGASINPVVGDFEFKVSAYSKPATIAKAGPTFFFDDENLAGSTDLGPNFGDYWFRSRKADSWTSRIEDLKQFTLNLTERMMQARIGLDQLDAKLLEAWDDLQLMTLALYGQWGTAVAGAGCTIERNDDKRLVDLLATSLTLTAAEVTKLNDRLSLFRTKLTETFDPADPEKNRRLQAGRRQLWLKVFQIGLDDPSLSTQSLLSRASESPLDLELVLFHQWNLAVTWNLSKDPIEAFNPDTDSLTKKWNQALADPLRKWKQNQTATTLPDAPLSLFVEAAADVDPAKMNYGVRTLLKRYWLCVSQDLLADPDAALARKKLAGQLKSLRNRIDINVTPQFFPQLVSEKLIGADKWKALWNTWQGDGMNDEGYVERFLKVVVVPPEVEEKPGGLNLVFDKPSAKGQQPPKVEVSAWRKLAGVGVVVREKKADPQEGWRMATASAVALRGVHVLRVARVGASKREIQLSVDVYPHAREGLYQLSIGGETFNSVVAVGQGNVTVGPVKVTPERLSAPATAEILNVKRTDKDFEDAALTRVHFDRLLTDTALVPMRVPFRNGVRDPLVTYNQRSLIASSHLNNAVRGDFGTRDAVATTVDALYEYTPAQNGNPTFDLVALKFGKTYQMAAFMVDTAGGLPAELSDTAPWKFKSTGFTVSQTPGVIGEFSYQRRVPVGQLRVSQVEDTITPQALNWPEWPENISPLAGETILNNKKNANDKPDDPEKRRRQTPLILLYGNDTNKTFVFGVKPPTCDLDVLERWENTNDALVKERLAKTFKQYFGRLTSRKDLPQAPSEGNEDASFDDPAVTHFLFVLESYDFEERDETRKWKVESFCTSEIIRDPTLKDISYYQKGWKKVSCKGGEKFEVVPSGDLIQVTVKNTEASVARLRSFALVPASLAGADRKFATGFFEADSPDPLEVFKFVEDFTVYQYQTPALKAGIEAIRQQFKCLKSIPVLIETPNADMPEARDLWRSIALRTLGPNRDTLTLTLERPLNLRSQFRNIVRCDILKQNWRWQGRPLDYERTKLLRNVWTADDGTVLDNHLSDVTHWEVSAFAEMHDVFDTFTIPLPYNFKSDEPLFTDKFDQSPLAQYVRYGVRAHSRYAALFANQETTVTSKQPYEKNVMSGVGWRRVLLRYRGFKPTKPLIKAIVPLTQADPRVNGNGAASPLMVALEETMFNHCGITEWIQCRIEKAKLYTAASPVMCDGKPRDTLHQAGHDPILTADNAVCELPDAAGATLMLEPVGPFGHTFDTGARLSLFSTSSFLLRPYEKAVDWDFAKVSFRRLTGNEAENDFGETTDWTVPVWLYFLPSSTFKIPDWDGGLSITWDSTSKKLGLTPAQAKIFQDLKKRVMFNYCLLLTRPVRDFRGQSEHEVYDRYIRLEYNADASSLQKVLADPLSSDTEYIARLVEVQVIRDTPSSAFAELPETGKEFWRSLLNDDDPGHQDAPFRITRVSPPKRLST